MGEKKKREKKMEIQKKEPETVVYRETGGCTAQRQYLPKKGV